MSKEPYLNRFKGKSPLEISKILEEEHKECGGDWSLSLYCAGVIKAYQIYANSLVKEIRRLRELAENKD